MGKAFKTYYDHSPDHHFYLCRHCRIHIADNRDFFMPASHPTGLVLVLENVAEPNLLVDGEQYYQSRGCYTTANVHCVDCNDLLGWKLVHVAPAAAGEPLRPLSVRQGLFWLRASKLLIWDGVEVRGF